MSSYTLPNVLGRQNRPQLKTTDLNPYRFVLMLSQGFPQLSTSDIWRQILGGLSCALSLAFSGTTNTPLAQLWRPKISPDIIECPLGAQSRPVENHC